MGRWKKLVEELGEEGARAEMKRMRQLVLDKGKPAGGLHYADQARRNAIMEKVRAHKKNGNQIIPS